MSAPVSNPLFLRLVLHAMIHVSSCLISCTTKSYVRSVWLLIQKCAPTVELVRMRREAARAAHAQSLSLCVTWLQCASPALASRHNLWDTSTHNIASILPSPDAPSFQIYRNDWPFYML